MSSSDEEDQNANKLIGNKRKRDEIQMHGATVVPEPAFLKHRKLLDKKF